MSTSKNSEIPVFLVLTLHVGSCAENTYGIHAEEEKRKLKELLKKQVASHRIALEFEFIDTGIDLAQVLGMYGQRIEFVHVIGHGKERELLMITRYGKEQTLLPEDFRMTLKTFKVKPRMAFFNACNSHEMAKALRKDRIPAIGYEHLVPEDFALDFCDAFYRNCIEVGGRKPLIIQEAMEQALRSTRHSLGSYRKPILLATNAQKAQFLFDEHHATSSPTPDGAMNALIQAFAAKVIEENWNEDSTEFERDKLQFYVHPDFRWVRGNSRDTDDDEKNLEKINDNNGTVDRAEQPMTIFRTIRREKMNLVLSDGAGAGKTIFSKKLAAEISREAVSQNSEPLMVFRWNSSLPYKKPPETAPVRQEIKPPFTCFKDLLLADKTLAKLDLDPAGREQLVNWALKKRRVVIILDGLDEFFTNSEAEVRNSFLGMLEASDGNLTEHADHQGGDPKVVTLIITGRQHAINRYLQNQFHPKRFRRIKILPWSKELQEEYFGEADSPNNPLAGSPFAHQSWRDALPADGEDLHELLSVPHTLFLLREALEGQVADQKKIASTLTPANRPQLTRYESASDLFLTTARQSLERALAKLKNLNVTISEKVYRQIGFVQSFVAFEMFRQGFYEKVKWQNGMDESEIVGNIREDAKRRFIESDGRATGEEFETIWRILNRFDNHDKGICGSFGSEETHNPDDLSFQNRRVQEHHAASFLVRHAKDEDYGNHLFPHICDPQWAQTLKWAVQTPIANAKLKNGALEPVYEKTLHCIFARPKWKSAAAGVERRPTEVMYKAIHFLETRTDKIGLITELKRMLAKEFSDIRDSNSPDPDARRRKAIADGIFVMDDWRSRGHQPEFEVEPGESMLVFVHPPAGHDSLTFVMGDERKPVILHKQLPFAIHKFPVRNKEFQLFDEGQKASLSNKNFADPDQPAVHVNWYDVQVFAWFLGEFVGGDGKTYRWCLPKESQWEYACRAPRCEKSKRPENSSDEIFDPPAGGIPEGYEAILKKFAWFSSNSLDKTHQPGTGIEPNPLGLFDMLGNVWEWCEDWYVENLLAPSHPIDPEGNALVKATYRVLRGGCWSNGGRYCRTAIRFRFTPVNRNVYYGFRLAAVRSRHMPEPS